MSHPSSVDLERGQVSGRHRSPGESTSLGSSGIDTQQPPATQHQESFRGTTTPRASGSVSPVGAESPNSSNGPARAPPERDGTVRFTSPTMGPVAELQSVHRLESPELQNTSQPELTAEPTRTRSIDPNLDEEIYGDPSRKVWSLALTQSEKHDKEMTEGWRDDTSGVLVFTGLFSATVAAFIIESYKKLSVDSGDQTVVLLSQLSQQLAAISNGTPLLPPPPLNTSPSNLNSIIRVNILWLLSFALSITCALMATLIQQWSRQYMELSQRRSAPHDRARVRTYLFTGVQKFGMRRAVETIPLLLHISVFLFFAGLVEFLIFINETVAWTFFGYTVCFALAYAVMTILPNFFLMCPYRTPFSGLLLRLSQTLVKAAVVIVGALGAVYRVFLLCWARPTVISEDDAPLQRLFSTSSSMWRDRITHQTASLRDWLKEGLLQSIVSSAISSPPSMDTVALTWTLTVIDEDEKVEDLVTCIPGLFESHFANDTFTMLDLMEPTSNGAIPALALRTRDLLTTCVPGMSRLDPMARKNRLYACLIAIWYFASKYSDPDIGWRMPKYFRILLGDPNDMNVLSADDDARTKAMALCVSSLVAANVVQGFRRRAKETRASYGELALLRNTLGSLWSPDLSLADRGPAELANLAALFEGLKNILSQDLSLSETLSSEVSKSVNMLVLSLAVSLPDALPINRWGSNASTIGHSHAVLKRCLSAYQELRTTIHLGESLRQPALLELVELLKVLDAKLAFRAVLYDLFQSLSQTHTEGGTTIVGIQTVQTLTNDLVTETPEALPQQAVPDPDEFALDEQHVRMPEPVQYSSRFEEGPPMRPVPHQTTNNDSISAAIDFDLT